MVASRWDTSLSNGQFEFAGGGGRVPGSEFRVIARYGFAYPEH